MGSHRVHRPPQQLLFLLVLLGATALTDAINTNKAKKHVLLGADEGLATQHEDSSGLIHVPLHFLPQQIQAAGAAAATSRPIGAELSRIADNEEASFLYHGNADPRLLPVLRQCRHTISQRAAGKALVPITNTHFYPSACSCGLLSVDTFVQASGRYPWSPSRPAACSIGTLTLTLT